MKTVIATTQFYAIVTDETKNRIFIQLNGFWTEEKIIDDYIIALNLAIAKMKPNFTLVVNLTKFKTLPSELVSKQQASMRALVEGGMYKVAEILPASAIAAMQLKASARSEQMPNKQFATELDGEKWLDEELKKL